MAASSVLVGNALSITYQTGVDSKGKDIFKGQNFKNVSSTATDDELVALCDAIDEVIEHNISTIKKVQTFAVTRG